MVVKKDICLLNGKQMPVMGLGTLLSKEGEVEKAVEAAVKAGYRLIDTAQVYDNEAEIGAALKKVFQEEIVKRDDMFITTKLAPAAMAPEDVRSETELSLKRLKLDYVDLYLIHLPVAVSNEGLKRNPPERMPLYANGALKTVFIDPLDTWREMEKLVDDGLVKAIGLSNFNEQQIRRIYEKARIKPANLQIECHAWFPQYDLHDFCRTRGISVSAYGPIGSPGIQSATNSGAPILLEEPVVKELAAKYSKTPAQILLRNLIQRGIAVIPKSVNPERIASNFDLWSFCLTEDDMHMIKCVNREKRLFEPSFIGYQNFLHPFFPYPELVGNYVPGQGLPQK